MYWNCFVASSSERLDLAMQVRLDNMHEQIASFGVGGSAVAACHVEVVGQAWGLLLGV